MNKCLFLSLLTWSGESFGRCKQVENVEIIPIRGFQRAVTACPQALENECLQFRSACRLSGEQRLIFHRVSASSTGLDTFYRHTQLMNLARMGDVECSIKSNSTIDWECMTSVLVMQCVLFFLAARLATVLSLSSETAASSLSETCLRALGFQEINQKI